MEKDLIYRSKTIDKNYTRPDPISRSQGIIEEKLEIRKGHCYSSDTSVLFVTNPWTVGKIQGKSSKGVPSSLLFTPFRVSRKIEGVDREKSCFQDRKKKKKPTK